MGKKPRPPGAFTIAFVTVVEHEMESRDWSTAELARRAGVPSNSVTSWFRHERSPSPEQMYMLAAALEVPLPELVERAVG